MADGAIDQPITDEAITNLVQMVEAADILAKDARCAHRAWRGDNAALYPIAATCPEIGQQHKHKPWIGQGCDNPMITRAIALEGDIPKPSAHDKESPEVIAQAKTRTHTVGPVAYVNFVTTGPDWGLNTHTWPDDYAECGD